MKESDDEFDNILGQADQYYHMGANAGLQQAKTYEMDQIKSQGFKFGQELGEQIAHYEQFIKAFQQLKINPDKVNPKATSAINFIKEVIQKIDFRKIESLKSQRKQLKYRFKVLLAMLGVKGYDKIKNGEQKIIQEENEGFDF